MDLKVIDNFLNENDFNMLINNTIGRNDGQQVQFRVVSNKFATKILKFVIFFKCTPFFIYILIF